ncbi:MAG: penicillin-binding protein 1C, partial [Mailhella sp.]
GAVLKTRAGTLPLRYKTGTSNGFRDAWTAGIVGEYVLIVWVGNFDNRSNPYFIGAKTAAPLFMEIVHALSALRPLSDPLSEQRKGLNIAEIPVCSSTGDTDVSRCRETEKTLFIPGVSPVRDSGIIRPILIDKASGLRACEEYEGETELVYWEFWPSDVRRIFARAGINKALPPEWLPVCRQEDRKEPAAGKAPRILLPKKQVTYYRKIAGSDSGIPLLAAADPDVKRIHWFAGTSYLGSSPPGEPFFWKPDSAGLMDVAAVDDAGRSTSQKCRIQLVP